MPPGGRTPASGSRELRAKKEISVSTTVPTAWQINVSLTLPGGSFRVVRMPASITLNFAEIPRETPEDSGHLARERRRARRNTESKGDVLCWEQY
jgi:hypothetical protein